MKPIVVLNLVVLLCMAGLYTNCSSREGESQSSSSSADSLTWDNDIRDILEARCTVCHYSGGGLPVWTDLANSIDGYDDIVARQTEVFRRVITLSLSDFQSMPASNATNMTQAERDTVEAWMAQGLRR